MAHTQYIRKLVAYLFFTSIALAGCGGGEGGSTSHPTTSTVQAATRAEPVKASADALAMFAGALGHPLYWATGEKPASYELTRTSDDRVYIRYLAGGVEIGDPRPDFLTVGTYPQADAFAAVERGAKRAGATVVNLAGGGLMVSQKSRPTSAFFSSPGLGVLVEVYDPAPGRAARLIATGAVRPLV